MASKVCNKCLLEKPNTEFYKNRSTLNTKCKSCHNKCSKEWRLKNKDYRKNYDLKRHYGISTKDRQDLFDAQGGKCGICAEALDDGFNTHIDHCHASLRVRGLLCNHCNTGLGKFKDNIDILESAIRYLAETKRRVAP